MCGTGITGLMISKQNMDKDGHEDIQIGHKGEMYDKPDQSKSIVGGSSLRGPSDNVSACEEQEIYVLIALPKDSTTNINYEVMRAQVEASVSDDRDNDGVMGTRVDESDSGGQLKHRSPHISQQNTRNSGKGVTFDEQMINTPERTESTAERGERPLDITRTSDEKPDEDPSNAILAISGKASDDGRFPLNVATASGIQVDSSYLDNSNEPLSSSVSHDQGTTRRPSQLKKGTSRRKFITEDSESNVEMHEVKKIKTTKGRDETKSSTSSEYDKSRFKCNFCERAFMFKSLVDCHKRRVHTKEKTGFCRHCWEGFYKAYDLTCLKREVLIVHKEYKDYVSCHICSKRMKETSMKQHVKKMHGKIHRGRNPSQKLTEENKSTEVQNLEEEENTANNETTEKTQKPEAKYRFQCDVCEKTFESQSQVKGHRKRVHLWEKTHFCPKCPEGFYLAHDLRQHIALVHKGYDDNVDIVCHMWQSCERKQHQRPCQKSAC